MKYNDLLWLSLKGISERKMRAALTVLSVAIGVAAIVALVSLVSGASAGISKSLSTIGPTSIFLSASGQHILTDADVAEIESLPNVSVVVPAISFPANITISGQQLTATIVGVSNYSLSQLIGNVSLLSGSVFQDTSLPFGLVGYNIAFPTSTQQASSVTVSNPIYITTKTDSGEKSVTIIPSGILNAYGSAAFISPDTSIFIPIQAAEAITNKYSYNIIVVKATNTTTVAPLYALLTTIYGNTLRVISVQQIAQTVSSITGSLSLLLAAIAGISLIVAGISILSIMMVSVAERTHEIGILKSIGFSKRDVLMLFLSEALIIGLLGGIIGVAAGVGGSYGLAATLGSGAASSGGAHTTSFTGGSFRAGASGSRAAFAGGPGSISPPSGASASSFSLTPSVSITIVIAAILVAVAVSVAASMYPAWKASTVDPIKALRSE